MRDLVLNCLRSVRGVDKKDHEWKHRRRPFLYDDIFEFYKQVVRFALHW